MKKSKKIVSGSVAVPEGVTVVQTGISITIKGASGEVTKLFPIKNVKISPAKDEIKLDGISDSRKEKRILATVRAHLRNMVNGVQKPHSYTLKICSGHFPMSVAISGNTLVVKNFVGGKVPRITDLDSNVTVKVKGKDIFVESCDKDAAGTVASRIEKLTIRPNFDRRIFQDGIFITNKAGKVVK